jgi:dimethylaniline monooxygenase (N-oxide forming)
LTHDKVKEYLDAYCEQFDLKRHIKFGHEIVKVEQVAIEDQWQIITKSDAGLEAWLFDKVVMATGRFQLPLWPQVENLDKFEGELIHSSRYRLPCNSFLMFQATNVLSLIMVKQCW